MPKPPTRKANNPPMTADEMIEAESKRLDNKLHAGYRVDLSALQRSIQKDLQNLPSKISLEDLEAVKAQTGKYLKACETAKTLPSIFGLARALGYSRSAIYMYLDQNARTPSAQFLEIVRDALAGMLDFGALSNKINTIAAIFVLKSVYQRIDRSELFLNTQPLESPLVSMEVTADELTSRYLPPPDIDD